jgi:L-ascorbate metabolism protein UlaG (beta-lactamase superfamily)
VRLLPFLIIATLALPASTRGEETSRTGGLQVTHIAQSGFLFAGDGRKVLVDALFRPSDRWRYAAPSAALLQKMEQGLLPFDAIDLVLISHDHIDHFSPSSGVRFLLNSPGATLLTTPEVRDRMKKEGAGFDRVADRVVVPRLAWKQSEVRKIGGIRVEVARLKHGNDRDWPTTVYVFLFDLGGQRVLHAAGTTGHFPHEYEALRLAERNIDLAFLYPHLMVRLDDEGAMLDEKKIGLVRELIAPRIPVLTHVRPDRLPLLHALLPELDQQLPGLILFRKEMESRSF